MIVDSGVAVDNVLEAWRPAMSEIDVDDQVKIEEASVAAQAPAVVVVAATESDDVWTGQGAPRFTDTGGYLNPASHTYIGLGKVSRKFAPQTHAQVPSVRSDWLQKVQAWGQPSPSISLPILPTTT